MAYPFEESKKKTLHQRLFWIVWVIQICAAIGTFSTPDDSLANGLFTFVNLFLFTMLMIMLYLDLRYSMKKHKKFMYELNKEMEILRKQDLTDEDFDELDRLRSKRHENT